MRKGLLIDYRYCSGCHTCEIACQQEHKFTPEEMGIRINTIGPVQYENGEWQFDNIPTITALCDMCEQRVSSGKGPSCVQHCQAGCMYYGDIETLAAQMDHEKAVLFTRSDA